MSILGALSRRLRTLSPSLDTRLTWIRFRRAAPGLRLVDAIVQRGDFAIDVGAADGLYAARLSQIVGRRGRVYTFEPNPMQFGSVQALAVRRRNVTAYPVALSDQSGEAELHIPVIDDDELVGLGSLAIPEARAAIRHRVVSVTLERLDSLLAGASSQPAFLKCDVEGHELAVLRGAEKTLLRAQPKLLVEIEQRHQDRPIQGTFDYLEELGYAGYALKADGLRPLDEFSVERDQLAFLSDTFEEMPAAGYVNDFLFVPAGTDMTRLAIAAAPSP